MEVNFNNPFSTQQHLFAHTQKIEDLFAHAANVDVISDKASIPEKINSKKIFYNQIFQLLKLENSPSLPLFRLFEEYASKTCYAQVNLETKDDEEGFRKSARLLELSLSLQLSEMKLLDFKYDWKDFENLESLITNLHYEKDQKGLFFDTIEQLTIDPNVLVQNAGDNRDILAKTLLKLTYSHQNIESLISPSYANFHKRFNELTESVIGQETEKQKQDLVDYRYNRSVFLTKLTSDSFESQFECYTSVLDLGKKIYAADSPKLMSLTAKIANMRGLLILRRPSTPTDSFTPSHYRDMASQYFDLAFELRVHLVANDPANRKDHEYFLSNVLTGVVYCLVNQPKTDKRLAKAEEYLNYFRSYNVENPTNAYHDCWEKAKNSLEEYRKS